MDAQSESEARQKGAAASAVSAPQSPAQSPAAPRTHHGFSTPQLLVMAASGCVFGLAVLILIVLANNPSAGTFPRPLVASPLIPKIAAALDAPLRSIPPPAPVEPPAPSPTEEPAASASAQPPPSPSPPSLNVAPAPTSSISPLVPPRPLRTTAPPPATPTATQQTNPGPLFQREN